MAISRLRALALIAGLTLGMAVNLAPGATFAQPAAAPAPAKDSIRTWTWNKVAGNWKRMKGVVKERWGKLTHDEIRASEGRRETLNGYIQSRYGIDREAADKQIDAWLKTLK